MIKVTDAAREKLIDVMINENAPFLRFGLQGGGCNGFTYFFSVEDNSNDDDYKYNLDESHTLLIDSMSSLYLDQAEIDVKKDIMGETFVFNNPNATGSCGCGASVTF